MKELFVPRPRLGPPPALAALPERPAASARAGLSATCQNFPPDIPSGGGPTGPAVLPGVHCPFPSLRGSHVPSALELPEDCHSAGAMA